MQESGEKDKRRYLIMRKVLVTTSSFGKHGPNDIQRIKDKGFEVVLNPFGRTLTEREVKELVLKYCPVGMISGVEPINAKILERADSLKIISRCGIGLSNVDIEFAEKMGIKVLNTPDAPTEAVAELTIALILSLLRRLGEADRYIRQGAW